MTELRPASLAQLQQFVDMERGDDTAPYILPTTLEQHREAFARDDIVYLSINDGGELGGFFILALETDGCSVEFRRIVVARKGHGTGKRAIAAMENYCRECLQRSRIWLDVFDFNLRGQHIYSLLGYKLFERKEFQGKQLLFYQKELGSGRTSADQ